MTPNKILSVFSKNKLLLSGLIGVVITMIASSLILSTTMERHQSFARCPNGYHISPSGVCEQVIQPSTDLPRCPNGYHRSPSLVCEPVTPSSNYSPYQNPTSPYQNPTGQQQPSATFNSTTFSNQQLPTLIIVTRVNNTGGGLADAANFSQVVANAYNNPDGYTYSYHFMRGSQVGVTLNLQPGVFAVYEPSNNTKSNPIPLASHSYRTAYSGDCTNVKSTINSAAGSSAIYGYGMIKPGESKTCIVTNSYQKE
jgi:hypothetical protein